MLDVPMIFLDTETTGLQVDADIWEFAGVRRNLDGTSDELHMFIEHSEEKCRRLPVEFFADHDSRFPHLGGLWAVHAASKLKDFLARRPDEPRPVIVGSAPDFDTTRIQRLIDKFGPFEPQWDHQLLSVVPLMVGYLSNRSFDPLPVYKSEQLSLAVGVDPDDFERHTAMGDVRWTMAIYDRIMGSARWSWLTRS